MKKEEKEDRVLKSMTGYFMRAFVCIQHNVFVLFLSESVFIDPKGKGTLCDKLLLRDAAFPLTLYLRKGVGNLHGGGVALIFGRIDSECDLRLINGVF